MWIRSNTAHARSEAAKHAPKLHLDAWIVSSRSNMPRLSALHSLGKGRVSTFAIQLRTNVENRAMDRSLALFAQLAAMQRVHFLVILKRQGSLDKPVAISFVWCCICGSGRRSRQLAAHLLRSTLYRISSIIDRM